MTNEVPDYLKPLSEARTARAKLTRVASANRKDISTASRGVTLEHRHFSFIAATIARCVMPCAAHDHLVDVFANECSRTNPKFDRARFIAACNAGV